MPSRISWNLMMTSNTEKYWLSQQFENDRAKEKHSYAFKVNPWNLLIIVFHFLIIGNMVGNFLGFPKATEFNHLLMHWIAKLDGWVTRKFRDRSPFHRRTLTSWRASIRLSRNYRNPWEGQRQKQQQLAIVEEFSQQILQTDMRNNELQSWKVIGKETGKVRSVEASIKNVCSHTI